MVHPLTVTTEPSSAPAPVPTLVVTISAERGIEAEPRVPSGRHTVAVHFADQKTHEHHLGHDVHLARMKDDTEFAAILRWMDWTQPEGLETPAPAEFLGGTHEMPAGETGYFTVDLEPGHYAWIAEVPDAETKGMLTRFIVSSP